MKIKIKGEIATSVQILANIVYDGKVIERIFQSDRYINFGRIKSI